jgi:hypothetical protein
MINENDGDNHNNDDKAVTEKNNKLEKVIKIQTNNSPLGCNLLKWGVSSTSELLKKITGVHDYLCL